MKTTTKSGQKNLQFVGKVGSGNPNGDDLIMSRQVVILEYG